MARYVKSGKGWRIGWNDEAEVYQGLIGGDRWSFELTEKEFKDFCALLFRLDSTVQHMAAELMESEKINCEVESELIWLEADGYPHAYELHIITQQHRRAEGFWSPSAVPDLICASQTLGLF
jgi:hypothetical protein